MRILRVTLILLALFFMIDAVSAQAIEPFTKSQTFADLLVDAAKVVRTIVLPLAGIFIIWSGFLFVSAGGSEDKIKKAKQTFFWTIIGTVVVVGATYLAEAIVKLVEGL